MNGKNGSQGEENDPHLLNAARLPNMVEGSMCHQKNEASVLLGASIMYEMIGTALSKHSNANALR